MPFYHRSISLKDSWYPCSFNLTYRASVSGAPSNFIAAMETAALMIRKTVLDDVTFSISVGYDEVSGVTLGTSGGSSILSSSIVPYSLLRSALIAKASSATDASVLASMPAGSDIGDGIHSTFNVALGQMKALGLSDPHDISSAEGQIGIGALIPEGNWIGAMIHELTHSMGRSPGYCDWVIWSAPGVRQFTGSQPFSGYFSVDGGVTNLGNMSSWDSPSFTGITTDPLDEYYVPGVSLQHFTPLDVTMLDAIGFRTS